MKTLMFVMALVLTPMVASAGVPTEAQCKVVAEDIIYTMAKSMESGTPKEDIARILLESGFSLEASNSFTTFVHDRKRYSPDEITAQFLAECVSEPT